MPDTPSTRRELQVIDKALDRATVFIREKVDMYKLPHSYDDAIMLMQRQRAAIENLLANPSAECDLDKIRHTDIIRMSRDAHVENLAVVMKQALALPDKGDQQVSSKEYKEVLHEIKTEYERTQTAFETIKAFIAPAQEQSWAARPNITHPGDKLR